MLPDILGENGTMDWLWKNLRHHLAGADEGTDVAGRIVQYMAERSTWRVDKVNHAEGRRKEKDTNPPCVYGCV